MGRPAAAGGHALRGRAEVSDPRQRREVHPRFEAVATGTGVEALRTPIKAPRANAICERLLGSVRRECLDHILILSEAHLRRVLKEYALYFNRARPHQGIGQRLPQAEPDRTASDQGKSLPRRCWVACTTTIDGLPDPPECVSISLDAAGSQNKAPR